MLLTVQGIGATSAAAAESTVPPYIDNPQNAVTADALPTTQINGVAWDQVIVGNTVYVGGSFTSARPAGSALGTNESPRANLMSYNLTTGVMTSWAPEVNGQVRVVTASPDGKRLYIGGSFTQVNGKIRSRIAAFDTATGQLVDDFVPLAGSDVFGITATNSVVYFGGWFTTVNGVERTRLAAVNASNGSLTAWAPTADFTVWGLGLTQDASRVVVAGAFQNLNGSPATSLGSLSATDGTSYPFAANQVIHNYGNTAAMMSMKVVDGRAYSTAYWYGGTGNFEGAVILDPYDGTILNMANCLGDTYDAQPMNGLMYMVSHHHQCTDIGGFTEGSPRRWQHNDAMTIETTGQVQKNTYGYPNFEGNPAGSYVQWAPTMQIGKASGQDQAGWTVEASGDYLVVGGEFPTVNGTAQQGLVRFTTRANGAAKKIGPSAPAASITPTLRNMTATSTRLVWMSDFDRDGMDLTYNVQRRVKGTTPITTVKTLQGKSTWWVRPMLKTIDDTMVSGTTYQYRLYVLDVDGNGRYTPWVDVTAGTDVPVSSPYSDQVFEDGAVNYWRFNDPSGSSKVADWAGADDLTPPAAGLSLGTQGAITGSTDTAGTFNGANKTMAVGTRDTDGPDNFSAEMWFRTTTNKGGKLLGFGNGTTTNSGSYDRHVYMRNDGRLTFGVYDGASYVITSPSAYNDGAWHQVVVSLSPDGMTMYVDGVRQGRRAQPTKGQPYTGRWHIGGDTIGGWPTAPTSNFFAGDIDDVAIYGAALTKDQIRDHFVKSGRTISGPALPTDGYGRAVTLDDPAFYWRLGEPQTASTAQDSSGNGFTGTFMNDPLRGVAAQVAANDTATQFDGANDFVSSDTQVENPTVFSLEAWFKTTSTAGGKIIGFGNSRTGNSGSYDRHIYMNAAGQLRFGAYSGTTQIAGTTTSYNDGAWHHVVGSLGPNGMKLYVDGALVAENGNTGAQNFTGYWRVGGDSTWEGAQYFAGTIDDVAVYDKVLTPEQVANHHQVGSLGGNNAPSAVFTSQVAGLKASLDASGSSDPDGDALTYAWTFGDGSTGTGAQVEHTFAAAGTYQVTLTVTDARGATASKTETVSVEVPNTAPTAAFTSQVTGLKASLDASDSSDPDGDALTYGWEFGDGSTGTGAQVEHTFAAAGTYQVTLTVTDARGATASKTQAVSVAVPNGAPTAEVATEVDGLKVSVDGSGSSDPDGDQLTYAWEFGDGSTGTGATASHTYATDGTYTVKLTVTDSKGATDVATKSVTVSAPAAPTSVSDDFNRTVASGWGTAQVGGPWTVNSASTMSVNGSAAVARITAAGSTRLARLDQVSMDDVSILTDVTLDRAPAGGNYYHYVEARIDGTSSYRVTLRLDASGDARIYISKVTSGSEKVLKTTVMSGFNYAAGQKLNLRFDVTGDDSVALDAKVWRSTENESAARKVSATDSSDTFGAGSIGLRMYTGAGFSALPLTATVGDLTAGAPTAPVNGAPTAKVATEVDGLKVSVDGSGSSDPDGDALTYAWEFGDGSTGTGATASHTYDADGTYTVKLTVTDSKGATDVATKSVTVAAPVATSGASDSFNRTVASGWGTAEVGGAWTVNSASTMSVNGSAAAARITAAGSTRMARLNLVSAEDVSILTDVTLDRAPAGGNYYHYIEARIDGTSFYRVTLRLDASGDARIYISKVTSGSEKALKTTLMPGFNYAAGEKLNLRFDVTGDDSVALDAKVWRSTENESAAVKVSATDSSDTLGAGSVGLRMYTGGGFTGLPLTATVDNYEIED
ncbi:MAG: PKD domain-containing protein [Arachnia sp.]